jgi:hypothetical protein
MSRVLPGGCGYTFVLFRSKRADDGLALWTSSLAFPVLHEPDGSASSSSTEQWPPEIDYGRRGGRGSCMGVQRDL